MTIVQLLKAHGWKLVPPFAMSLDVFGAYPAYIRQSRAEFTVAKDQNIRLRSGWFSERDACYLACGKPVIAQETGFSNIVPTGEGLFAFTTMAEALTAIETINRTIRATARRPGRSRKSTSRRVPWQRVCSPTSALLNAQEVAEARA